MHNQYTGNRGELNFEDDFIERLIQIGWSPEILGPPIGSSGKYITAAQEGPYDENNITSLEGNLRKCINQRNKSELNNIPLSDDEFQQVMTAIYNADTPVKANKLIQGQTLVIRRDADSPDTDHKGNDVYLRIFERQAIGTGDTIYQIAHQVRFKKDQERRGDITLLINGLPLIHIELKAQGVATQEALNQIDTYKNERVFTGIMQLVQVFFAATPDDIVYFANYKSDRNRFTAKDFVFHWATKEKNERIRNWLTLCGQHGSANALLSIPEAHQLISHYTVADKLKDTLKVMRSYQYYAIRAILDRTSKHQWCGEQLGGVNWCTTGGGKTMTSYKAGEMLIDLQMANKVVFVVDRTELNNQSLEDYNSFARDGEEVAATESSHMLFEKMKSNDTKNSMIVTSIQKMNRISQDFAEEKQSDMAIIQKKRMVFIVDEAQRSQFGEMHSRIKATFPNALFFGFTGTPIISDDDSVKTTKTIFGEYLSMYTIKNGIEDGNVLGFDCKSVKTYEDKDLRTHTALAECGAATVKDAKADPTKKHIYDRIMSMPMEAEPMDADGKRKTDKKGRPIKGIEGRLPSSQYNNDDHREAVVKYIIDNWDDIGRGSKGTLFHALLATDSIDEVIAYYRLFKQKGTDLHITTLFDFSVAVSSTVDRAAALDEILADYNAQYDTNFDRQGDKTRDLSAYKKDVMARLAHKKPYAHIEGDHNKMIDLLIVDDQLLTGYDSQYINALYLDKVLESHRLIQAMSRTNRIYDSEEKPFGTIRFFRKVYTMQKNLEKALQTYCEGDTSGVMARSVDETISEINATVSEINHLFRQSGIQNFQKLPDNDTDRQKFKVLFNKVKSGINAIRLQGGLRVDRKSDVQMKWDASSENGKKLTFNDNGQTVPFIDSIYNKLATRYVDAIALDKKANRTAKQAFDIDTNVSEIEIDRIDSDYLEKHFRDIVLTLLDTNATDLQKDEAIDAFRVANYGSLTERQQFYGDAVLYDIRNGILVLDLDDTTTFVSYIAIYIDKAKQQAIHDKAERFGIPETDLQNLIDNYDDAKLPMQITELCKKADPAKLAVCYPNESTWQARKLRAKELEQFITFDIHNI